MGMWLKRQSVRLAREWRGFDKRRPGDVVQDADEPKLVDDTEPHAARDGWIAEAMRSGHNPAFFTNSL